MFLGGCLRDYPENVPIVTEDKIKYEANVAPLSII